MILRIKPDTTFVIFDLDDTLYKEIDFVKSAYTKIAKILEGELGRNIFEEMLVWYHNDVVVFDKIKKKYSCGMTVDEMIEVYRFHTPVLTLDKYTKCALAKLRDRSVRLGVLTDGRSRSQRAKLRALGIDSCFDEILISEEFGSEKPSPKNFEYFADKYPGCKFIYIGDNFRKDFVVPNLMNWMTIGLIDDGRNIHSQSVGVARDYLPKNRLKSFEELIINFI